VLGTQEKTRKNADKKGVFFISRVNNPHKTKVLNYLTRPKMKLLAMLSCKNDFYGDFSWAKLKA
jgi:hypothetical protein